MPDVAREFFVSGGTLPLDSESYIERAADRDVFGHLQAARYCYVLNARQVGKSSLSVRTIAKLNQIGIRTVFIDLTQIGGRNVQPEQWYAGLTGELGRALGLSSQVMQYFKSHSELSPMQRFFGAVLDVALARLKEPIVIFVDEIDGTRNLPFDTDEFFAGIRECYNRRVSNEACRRLTFCLLGVAVPSDLIRDVATTPFNIGERILLQDFSLQDVKQFAHALGPNGEALARRVHHWTNGQPYLTQSLCQEIAADPEIQDELTVDGLVARRYFAPKSLDTNLNLSDVANRVLNDRGFTGEPDKFRADLLSAYLQLRKGGWVKDDEANRVAIVLKLSGLTCPDGHRLMVRNRIYRHVFDHAWVMANMPGQELMRQRRSFRRGMLRGILAAAGLAAVVGTLGILAFRAREEAEEARSALRYELYVSDMNSLRLYDEIGDSARMAAVLERQRKSPYRNFEWDFWMGRLHDSPEEYTLDYSAPGKIEQGFLSMDGRQICIEDGLAGIAVVVDRVAKKVLAKSEWANGSLITATDAGIVAYRRGAAPISTVNVVTGKVVSHFGTPGCRVTSISFLERGNFIECEETNEKTKQQSLTVWDLRDGREICDVRPGDGLQGIYDISTDGRRITYELRDPPDSANREEAKHTFVVEEVPSHRVIDRFTFGHNPVIKAFSPSGKLYAYLETDGSLTVRSADLHKTLYSGIGQGDFENPYVSFAPDDKSMITVSSDGTAKVRELPSGLVVGQRSKLRRIEAAGIDGKWIGSSSSVRVLDLSPRGQGIVGAAQTASKDGLGAIRLSSEHSSIMHRITDPELLPLAPLRIPPGGIYLTYNRLWCMVPHGLESSDVVSIDGLNRPLRIPFDVTNFTCGIRPDVIAIGRGRGNWFYGYDGLSGKQIWSANFDPPFRGLWMSPDGKRLIGATFFGRVASLDPRTGHILQWIAAHKLMITCLSFSRDSRYIVTGGGDGQAILWDADTLRQIVKLVGNGARAILSTDVSPDGKRVATCDVTGEWQLWDAETGKELTEVQASTGPLQSVMFTTDGRNLITAGDDNTVRAWVGLDKDPTVRVPVPPEALKNIGF